MIRSSQRSTLVSLSLVLTCVAGGSASGDKSSVSATGSPSAKVSPGSLQARAMMPPPTTATKKASIGSGKTVVQTANALGETDSYWVEQIDIDGDGTVEQTEFLWDDEDKVLFAYSETDVPCTFGGTSVVAIVACINAAGNPRGRPVGSGFYAVYFDGTECGADEAGLFGCTFNAAGDVTAWAAVVVDSAGDEIDVVDGTGLR